MQLHAGFMKGFSSAAKSQRPLRTLEVRSSSRSSSVSSPVKKGDPISLDPFPAVVVPLPRRPLFPGYCTSVFLKNQLSLARSLCPGKTMAVFMLKDATDYRGCILRPGLQGKDLLKRLHTVGTLATFVEPIDQATSRVGLFGSRRVQMTDCVIRDDPLTVAMQPLEMEDEDDHHTDEVARDYEVVYELFEKLSGWSIWDPSNLHTSYYLRTLNKVPDAIADFGPAVMPVLDRGLHQRALEERKVSKRLKLTIEILKRELELDNMTRRWHLDEEGCTVEEKEYLDRMRSFGYVGFDGSDPLHTGELPIAPSVGWRVVVDAFHKVMPTNALKEIMQNLRNSRLDEHCCGY